MSSTEKAIVYLDLESLMDLRQGWLVSRTDDPEALIKYVISDEYNYREMDKFPDFTKEDYREYMKEPDKSILSDSQITYLLGIVKNTLDGGEVRDKFNGELTTPVLWFNTHPFKLTTAEKNRLRDLLFIKLGSCHQIEMMELTMDSLSPNFLSSGGFIAAFIYDFTGWANKHAEALQTTPLHDCPLHFAPVYSVEPTKEERKELFGSGFKDPFSYIECVSSPVAKIVFLPMLFYSNIVVAQRHLKVYNENIKERFSKEAEAINTEEFTDGDIDK